MSMWTIVASGANFSTAPVMRSSKRAPIVMRRSLLQTAQLPATVPCMPYQ